MGDLTPNFSRSEFMSHDGAAMPSELDGNLLRLAQQLQALRDELGQPITIHSGYRSAAQNIEVGGEPHSRHLTAEAADFGVSNHTLSAAYCRVDRLISASLMRQGGLGIYTEHVHYDTRGSRVRGFGDVAVPRCPPPPKEDTMPKHLQLHTFTGWFLIAAGYVLTGKRPPKWLRLKIRYILGGD